MKNLIEFILIHLVDHPEDVRVEEDRGEHETFYLIHVHDEDIGRVIGKGGSVIQAIRQIVRVRATKEGERVRIDIHTEEDRTKGERSPQSEPVTAETETTNDEDLVETKTPPESKPAESSPMASETQTEELD